MMNGKETIKRENPTALLGEEHFMWWKQSFTGPNLIKTFRPLNKRYIYLTEKDAK